jgi:hypothetical protein
MPENITWRAMEHHHTEKGSDWFWALGIIAVSSAVVALLFNNFLFALLIIIGSFTMALLASQPPRELQFTLTKRGIMIDRALYPYKMLMAFWIEEREDDVPILIVDAQRFLTPHLLISLEDVDAEEVREYLLEYLPEEELHEPFAQRLAEALGFF